MTLRLNYRYAPQWRYKFETGFTRLKQTLQKNLVDRTPYTNCSSSSHFDGFNFATAIDSVTRHSAELDKIHKELLEIEKIFPASIANSNDPAYKNYVALRQALEDEMNFQSNYLTALGFFNNDFQTRGSALDLLGKVDDFITYFNKKDNLAGNVVKASQDVLANGLMKSNLFMTNVLATKTMRNRWMRNTSG